MHYYLNLISFGYTFIGLLNSLYSFVKWECLNELPEYSELDMPI